MVAFNSLAFAATTLISLTAAAPLQERHMHSVHPILVGATTANNGLHFEPENVVAEPGDIIEFHFLAKNHTVTQSSFAEPCKPLTDGFFSGFNFAVQGDGEAENVFKFKVEDRNPIWYYCSQPTGDHCVKGMSGVINQNFSQIDKTLAKYKEAAKDVVLGEQPSADIKASNGGWVVPNHAA